jgi:hypothetical protein
MQLPTLIMNELRMLWNQFKRTITSPSMLGFYLITFVGGFIITSILGTLISFSALFVGVAEAIEELISPSDIFAALGFLTVSSIIAGYVGVGPASVWEKEDESITMPAPIHPYQLFISRYTRRVIRKVGYVLLALLVFLPLIESALILVNSAIMFVIGTILLLETNYFLGSIAAYIRLKLNSMFQTRLRHIALGVLVIAAYLPSSSLLSGNVLIQISIPANVFGLLVMQLSYIHAPGLAPFHFLVLILIGASIAFLFLVNLIDRRFYDVFAGAVTRQRSESKIAKKIRGDVDFSDSKIEDPLGWIVLKDFWSKMRSLVQFWKYIYVIIGSAFAVYLNLLQPTWLPPLQLPPELSQSLTPAFLLVLALVAQLVSLPALLAFVDERENIYLLKASPFRSSDIVLAKYSLSLLEIGLSSLPILGFLLYFFRAPGSAFIITLAGPMMAIFAATGIMTGAYVPVFTNNPQNPPVPIAFSFPAINLGLGVLIAVVASNYAESIMLLFLLPSITIFLVFGFLWLSMNALNSYK